MNPHDERAGAGLRYRSSDSLPLYYETERERRNRMIIYTIGAGLFWGTSVMVGVTLALLVRTGTLAAATVLAVTVVLAFVAYAAVVGSDEA